MRVRRSLPFILTLGLLAIIGLVPTSGRTVLASGRTALARQSAPRTVSAACIAASTAAVQPSISFEANQGQANSQVRFLARGPGYSFFLTPQEAVLALDASGHERSTSRNPFSPAIAAPSALASSGSFALVGMQFLNANPQPEVIGEQRLPGMVNYFLGSNPSNWHTGIPTYAQIRYRNLYPGIDLIYYSNQGHLEYDFIVSPGSDPSQIHLNFTGANRLSLDAQGELVLHLPAGDVSEGAPQVYQEMNGAPQPVAGSYVLQGTTSVGFALGAYNASLPLIIDPSVVFSTYLGGQDNDYVNSVTVDNSCDIYITGATNAANFPTQNPLQPTFGGGSNDVFITKMDATGTTLLYSTYLGGSNADWGNSIAVDSAGNAYITGVTFSTDFPTQNALQSAFGGDSDDAFVAEVNAAGSALAYSTYLGGNGTDWGTGIAVDSAGNAYVTGGTSSSNFPTRNALHATKAGNANAFVAEVNAAGSALVYSTYLGGSNYDYGAGIAVDSAGDAFVTGFAYSNNFPTHTPLQSAMAGRSDAFVAKLNAAGSALVYSTYLGGSGSDGGYGIAVDNSGNAYITGSTTSTNFPLHTALQSTNAGSTDAFVAKLNATGSALVYATYLGGNNDDEANSIAVDGNGSAYITGSTSSTNFPTHTPLQSTNAGGTDAFITRLNAAGNAYLYSGYLGGTSNDWGTAIAVDSMGYAYVAGATASSNFPTLKPIQTYGGTEDGFLTKVNLMAPGQFRLSPGNVTLTTSPGTSPSPRQFTLSNVGDAPLKWAANSLPSWLSLSPASGVLLAGSTQTLTLTFNITSTNPQVYTTNLVLTDPTAGNSTPVPITVVAANVSKTWYFAEGYTGGSFSEYLTLANPNAVAATVTVTYLLGSGSPIVKTHRVSANARATILVNQEVGSNRNVSMVVTSDQPIVAERPMYFTFTGLRGYAIPGGTDVLGATGLSTSFDFGYLDTNIGHATYLTILNQNSSALTATITYFPSGGGSGKTVKHSVAAHSRGTVFVNGDVSWGSYSALVTLSLPGLVERPLYLVDSQTHYTGSADVVGVAQAQTRWDFAEGYTSSTFNERYILSNPGGAGTATATLTFFRSNGTTTSRQVKLAPGQQVVVSANSVLGSNNVNNSAEVTSDLPILAERFISFKYVGPAGPSGGGATIPGASDVLGASAPGNLFYFAEGYTGAIFAEYLTIENPDPTNTATVQVTFLPSNGGAPTVRLYQIGHSSRFTLFTNSVMKNQSFSMVVESNVAIVAERPMYFIYTGGKTGGSDVVGYQP